MISDSCEMYADMAKLTQVVYNIMDNAIKYTPEGGQIRVRLIRSGRDAILRISDNGPGIPNDIRERMFYPLVSGREGGSGLGLTLAQSFVQQHHGTIDCESRPGYTCFTIRLPLGAS